LGVGVAAGTDVTGPHPDNAKRKRVVEKINREVLRFILPTFAEEVLS
jgi:hypothetical protein